MEIAPRGVWTNLWVHSWSENIVADTLSQLEFEETPAFKSEIQESHFYQDQMALSQQDVE